MAVCVAVDCMGGDFGPEVTVPACLDVISKQADLSIILVGQSEKILDYLPGSQSDDFSKKYDGRLRIHHTSEVVLMDESVSSAMRNKKDSSIRVASELVSHKKADAVVSSGNTGALMAISRFVLKMLPGIERPAIATVMPTMNNGRVYMLDLGANVDCSANHLFQFGIMGSLLAVSLEHDCRPSVGLLNVGSEHIKGNEIVKQASLLLKESGLNFFGNVEGDDIFKGTTDVVVCDGFVGNVALKATEGLVQMLSSGIRAEFKQNYWTKLLALISSPVLLKVKNRFDHRSYNGACLLGLNGLVIKSHGSADKFAFSCAIERAAEASREKLVDRISQRLEHLPKMETS